jgi:hypothetical protein
MEKVSRTVAFLLELLRGSRLMHIVGIALLALGCKEPPAEILPVQMPELTNRAVSPLLMRRELPEGGSLLITTELDEIAYRYDPTHGSLSPVAKQAWHEAHGDVGSLCNIATTVEAGSLKIRIFRGKLTADERSVGTAGDVVMAYVPSPDLRYVAVLSAEDRFRMPSLFPALGGDTGPPTGQRYHEILRVPELTRVGEAVPVGIMTPTAKVCWSPDARFVLYMDIHVTQIVVVPTEMNP